MGSYDFGKDEVRQWVRNNFPSSAQVLDVGACDGKWRRLLPEYPNMDAVEVFAGYLSIVIARLVFAPRKINRRRKHEA